MPLKGHSLFSISSIFRLIGLTFSFVLFVFCSEVSGQPRNEGVLLDSGSVYERLCVEMLETAHAKGEYRATYCGDENKRLPDSQVTKEYLYLRFRKPDGKIELLPQVRTHFFAKVPAANDTTVILCLGNRVQYVQGANGTITMLNVDPRNQNFDLKIQEGGLIWHAEVKNGNAQRIWQEPRKTEDISQPESPVHQE